MANHKRGNYGMVGVFSALIAEFLVGAPLVALYATKVIEPLDMQLYSDGNQHGGSSAHYGPLVIFILVGYVAYKIGYQVAERKDTK